MKKLYNSPKLYSEKLFAHDVMAESSDFPSIGNGSDTDTVVDINNRYDTSEALFNYVN